MGTKPPRPPRSRSGLNAETYDALVRETAVLSAQATTADLSNLQRAARRAALGRRGKIRRAKFTAAVLALRLEGFHLEQIAEILGCSKDQARYTLERARVDETIDTQLDRLDKVVVPLAVDNVVKGVEAGDKDYTMKVLDGRGVFRTHKSIDAQVRRTTLEMKVVVTMPALAPGQAWPAVRPGAIVGAPSALAGDVLDVEPSRAEVK